MFCTKLHLLIQILKVKKVWQLSSQWAVYLNFIKEKKIYGEKHAPSNLFGTDSP